MTIALRPALSDLVHRYAAYADLGRIDELAGLFEPDGELVLPDPPTRLDAHRVAAGPARVIAELGALSGLVLTKHEIVGEVYDLVESDESPPSQALGRIACTAHHLSEGLDLIWHLHYDDEYRLHQGQWRFRRRRLEIDFITSMKVHRHR